MLRLSTLCRALVAASVVIVGGVVAAPASLACGGLFCAAAPPTPAPPEPVDQNAERIIFELDELNGKITAHVQIQYAGSADGFAWVVPMPTVPTVAESEAAAFEALTTGTAAQVQLPASLPCPQQSFGDSNGCGCSSSEASTSSPTGANTQPPTDGPVTVYAQDVTANYEYAVVGADAASDLIKWLSDNGYNVSDNMAPVMDPYAKGGMKFAALKLRADKTAKDVVPVAFTYEATAPTIPLKLTAVAAQPLMGVLVFVVADGAYEPAGDFDAVAPDTNAITFDGNGRTNYFAWVARMATEREGRRFVREFVGNTPEGAVGHFGRRVVSRYYTRLSPELMTADPSFAASAKVAYQENVLDLTAQPTLWDCGSVITERLPSPCAFTYCGGGATCVVSGGVAGCSCPSGEVGMVINSPDGAAVTCVPASNPYGITAEAGGAGGAFDPCASYDCGAGKCVLKSGFPTCECGDGDMAVVAGVNVSCRPATLVAQTFGPGAGPESRSQLGAVIEPARAASGGGFQMPIGLIGGLVFLFGTVAIRRRQGV